MASIWCFARTYRDHAAELGNAVPPEPVVFLKAEGTIRGLVGPAPPFDGVHHELELVLRLGRDLRPGGAGWTSVDAVALGLDLTHRPGQRALAAAGLPWTWAKSFVGASVLAPWCDPEVLRDRDAVHMRLSVDGVVRQDGTTADLVRPVPELLTWLSTWAPARAGDLVFTGTPAGVGPIRPGQEFAMELVAEGLRWEGSL
jgi:2-keto-4-pentenoate hydratase/2-oxohepta-3-ene-1,7-dioic acid hydratase in catechol pathway